MNTTATIPHDIDSERHSIGAVILHAEDGRDFGQLLSQLAPHLFHDLRCRGVFETARALAREKIPPTRPELLRRAKDHGNLQECGGEVFILSELDDGAHVSEFHVYLRHLKEHYVRRQLMEFGRGLVDTAGDLAVNVPRLQQELEQFLPQVGRELRGNKEPLLQFWTPQSLSGYQLPAGSVLVGDRHVVRGSVFAIAGHPGVGKSRAGTHLARCGALGCGEWFGFTVHRRFRTLILQNENGLHRLKEEFGDLVGFADWIRVSSPPPYGMQFNDPGFRSELAAVIADFQPEVVLLDPWNSVTRGDKQPDYLEALQLVRAAIPQGLEGPALGIVCHTKKPAGERKRGRALLHELSGSHVLGSVARAVFALEAATDEPEDDRLVLTCCKNNDGEQGPRSAWHRQANGFAPCLDFNWDEFDSSERGSAKEVTEEDLREIYMNVEGGQRRLLERNLLKKELMELTGVCRSTAYNAITRFLENGTLLEDGGKFLSLRNE